MIEHRRLVTALFAVLAIAGCPGDGEDDGDDMSEEEGMIDSEPMFPEDYEASYTEVRDCRGSGDHDLNNIRILVDGDALTAYEGRMEPFPEGAVVLKVEYDFGDTTCAGEIKQWTAMRKLAEGAGEDTLGWEWQKVNAERQVETEDEPRCIACHTGCGVEPDGYDATCSIPP